MSENGDTHPVDGKVERDRCGNYIHKLTCSRCKEKRTLITNVEKPAPGFVCFTCWKTERGLP